MASAFDAYRDRYADMSMTRTGGVLEVRLHGDGGPAVWSERFHREAGDAFRAIGADPENHVVILTGTGAEFLHREHFTTRASTPGAWDKIRREGLRLVEDLLAIEAPVIAAVNGPATIHCELALLSDIVLCSEDAYFEDAPHLPQGIVPGDGMHVLWPLLLGMNRGRHFLLTGGRLEAAEAVRLGVAAEVMPGDRLLARAHALAAELDRKHPLALRHTRIATTLPIRRAVHDWLGYGLALEALAAVEMRLPS